jgi:hypothetical protein
MVSRLRNRFHSFLGHREIARLKRLGPVDPADLERRQWSASLEDPLGFYLKCFRFFHAQLPERIRKHREYFAAAGRGFGEDAFHVMWFLLNREFGFPRFLEIGVYRGQVLSLISLLQQIDGTGGCVTGISPFCAAGDSVSSYRKEIDYLSDTLSNFRVFGLPEPECLQAYSTAPESVRMIHSRPWDCIYIDGNHDYEVAGTDWANAAAAVRPGGVLVLDDSALTTRFMPPRFATRGHPGPSRVAAEADRRRFEEILQVGHNRVFRKRA